MNIIDIVTIFLTAVGLFFFIAGTIGLLRFPDVFTRLHSLTKADNLGLGFVAFGLVLQAGNIFEALQIILIWLLVMVFGSICSFLVANFGVNHLSTQPTARAKNTEKAG